MKATKSVCKSLSHIITKSINPSSRCFSTSSNIFEYESIPKEKVDCVVIGAGVVGLAIARELAVNHNREVLVLESGPTFGTATSSRNSEVIHAGIYYPPNSLKAHFCVRGRELLYEYCKERGIQHKQIGKLIVATASEDIPKLDVLMSRGVENRVPGLRVLEGHEAMRLEPELRCLRAVLSPASGIVDSHTLMLSLVGEAESYGAMFSYNTTVIGGHFGGSHIQLLTSESESLENKNSSSLFPELILLPRTVVNSGGLAAPIIAKRFDGLDKRNVPSACYARGCYFTLSNTRTPVFRHLIYPIPEVGGLGVHVTLDLNGQVKFGPDVEWIEGVDDISSFLNRFDYSVSSDRANRFYPAIRRYYPNLKDGSLEPGYAGIRPKLSGPENDYVDFVIQHINGALHLLNKQGLEYEDAFLDTRWTCLGTSYHEIVGNACKVFTEHRKMQGKSVNVDWEVLDMSMWQYVTVIHDKWYCKDCGSVDRLFGITNLNRVHWVAYEYNFLTKEVIVYDSMKRSFKCVTERLFKMHAELAPSLYNVGCVKEELKMDVDVLFTIKIDDVCRQSNPNDYGIYAIKFMQCLAMQSNLNELKSSKMEQYRKNLGVDLVKWHKQSEGKHNYTVDHIVDNTESIEVYNT